MSVLKNWLESLILKLVGIESGYEALTGEVRNPGNDPGAAEQLAVW